jgi:hypothetical protein
MRFAWLIFFGVVGSAYAQQPISIENLFPEQLPRGETTVVNVAIQSREMFQGAELSPASGVTVARVESLKPAEDSQGVAWWRVTIHVAGDAEPGQRTLSLLTGTSRTAPTNVMIPAHVPAIARLAVQPHPQTVDVQFAMTDASSDIGDKPYIWFSLDCGKDPNVGVVRGTVAAGVVRASLPATESTSGCALHLRASDKNGIDSNTLTTRIN